MAVLMSFARLVERINVTFNSEEMFFNLGHAFIMFGIFVGGSVVLYGMRWLVTRMAFRRQKSGRIFVNSGQPSPTDSSKTQFFPRRGSSIMAMKHVLLELVFMMAVFAVFWAAAFTAGFNVFTSSYVITAVTLIATYMFAGALQNFGSGFWLNVEDAYQESNYIVVPQLGPDCHGFVYAKTAFHTTLRRLRDPVKGGLLEFRIPNTMMMSTMTFRDFSKELQKQSQLYEYDLEQEEKYKSNPALVEAAKRVDLVRDLDQETHGFYSEQNLQQLQKDQDLRVRIHGWKTPSKLV